MVGSLVSPIPYLQKRIKCANRCGFNLRDTKKNRERMARHESGRCSKKGRAPTRSAEES